MPGLHHSTDRSPDRRPVRGGVAFALLLAGGALVGACSSSAPAGPSADDAARSVVEGFGLESSELGCLEAAFVDEPSAREALSIGGGASTEQRDRLQSVLEVCITPLELGTALATATAAAIRGTDQVAEDCLRTTIENYDDDTRGVFLVGFVLSGDGAVTEIDADLGAKTDALFAACDVKLAVPDPTGPTATTPDQPGSAVSTP